MAVNVAGTPWHEVTFPTVTVGGETTVMVSACELEHPNASVAVKVYIVVAVGFTMGDKLVALVMFVVGVHAYEATLFGF